jgi:hypothetical protein
MAGLPENREEGESLETLDELQPTELLDLLKLGDGKRLLSWIWFTVSEEELSDDAPGVVDCESFSA